MKRIKKTLNHTSNGGKSIKNAIQTFNMKEEKQEFDLFTDETLTGSNIQAGAYNIYQGRNINFVWIEKENGEGVMVDSKQFEESIKSFFNKVF